MYLKTPIIIFLIFFPGLNIFSSFSCSFYLVCCGPFALQNFFLCLSSCNARSELLFCQQHCIIDPYWDCRQLKSKQFSYILLLIKMLLSCSFLGAVVYVINTLKKSSYVKFHLINFGLSLFHRGLKSHLVIVCISCR